MGALSRFDAIVVGAGAAGCVVARRLVDGGRRVLLVEAGPTAVTPPIGSVDAIAALAEPDWLWPGVRATVDGEETVPYLRGRGLGGSTAVNTLVAMPGDRAGYDRWSTELGCDGWDWSTMAGPVDTALSMLDPQPVEPGPLAAALTPVIAAAGHPVGGTTRDLDAVGLLRAAVTTRAGRRRSAADAYLPAPILPAPTGPVPAPAGPRSPTTDGAPPGSSGSEPVAPGLPPAPPGGPAAGSSGSEPVVPGRSPVPSGGRAARSSGVAGSVAGEDGGEGGGAGSLVLWGDRGVRRVVFDGRRATGIELDDGSVASAGLVVVCCGALHTPWLVRRSGIVAPAVGRSIEDHPSFTFTVELDPDARQPSDVPVEPISAVLRWHSIPGLAADAIPDTIPDTMALIMDHVGLGTTGRRFGAVIVALTDVASRGRVGEAPAFRPGWLDAADDGRRLVAAVRHVAGLLADGCFDPVVAGVHLDDRGTPLDALEAMSDSDVEGWLRRHPGPVSHIAGGCPPGGPDPVVEAGGALIGYDGLSIIDASVLPRLPSGNPQVAVMAVAERLSAELLK